MIPSTSPKAFLDHLRVAVIARKADELSVWSATAKTIGQPWRPMVWASLPDDLGNRDYLLNPVEARAVANAIRASVWLSFFVPDTATEFETIALEAEGLAAINEGKTHEQTTQGRGSRVPQYLGGPRPGEPGYIDRRSRDPGR